MTSQTHAAPAPVPATEGGWNPTVALAVRTCGLTHPGKVRENNQDHFVIAELSKLLRKGVHVEVHRLGLERGDTLVLCSDGLTEMVKDDRIRAVLAEQDDLQRACERLVALANDNGGKDNVTVVLGRFEAA